jgi:glycosyltransferase involved in cell wall biosynthesis
MIGTRHVVNRLDTNSDKTDMPVAPVPERPPVRVCHVLWRLSPSGGIPRVVRDLAAHADPASVEPSVVTVRSLLADDRLDEVIAPERMGSGGHGLRARRAHLAVAVPRIARQVRRFDPDIVHLHSGTSWLGMPGALVTPSAVRLLDVHDDPLSGRSSSLNVASMRLSVQRLRCNVVTHSTVVRDRTADAFGLDAHDVALVPLGVDTTSYRPDARRRSETRAALDLSDRPVVVWVGRLDPLKRPLDAVHVGQMLARAVPGAMLLIAGSGPLLAEVQAAAGNCDAVRVLGYVDDLGGLLSAADLYLSTSSYEGFGLSVAEAMASGLPVVSTRAGGVVDLVTEGVGALTDVGDVEALASAVERLLADPGRLAAMGTDAREATVDRFSVQSMVAGYERLYRSLLTGGR